MRDFNLGPKQSKRQGLEPTDGFGDACLGGHSVTAMCQSPSVVPRPVCIDEAVQGLVLTNSSDESMPCCLVVTTLDVEFAYKGFKDEGCDDGNLSFQQVSEYGVGAELSEDVSG